MAFDFKLRDRLASGVQRLRDKTDLDERFIRGFNTRRANFRSYGDNLRAGYKSVIDPKNRYRFSPSNIMGGNIAEIGQIALPTLQRANYSSPGANSQQAQSQNKFMRAVVPRYIEAATQAPGSFVQGVTHNLFNPLKNVKQQYGTTKVTNFGSNLAGFGMGPGRFYYNPIEAPVERAIASRLPAGASRLARFGSRALGGIAAEAVSSAPVSALQAKLEGRQFKDVYPEQVAYGLGSRALFGTLGAGRDD